MITQPNQILFINGALCSILSADEKSVIVTRWSNGALYEVKVKDMTLHKKGDAWSTKKAKKLKPKTI